MLQSNFQPDCFHRLIICGQATPPDLCYVIYGPCGVGNLFWVNFNFCQTCQERGYCVLTSGSTELDNHIHFVPHDKSLIRNIALLKLLALDYSSLSTTFDGRERLILPKHQKSAVFNAMTNTNAEQAQYNTGISCFRLIIESTLHVIIFSESPHLALANYHLAPSLTLHWQIVLPQYSCCRVWMGSL